MSPLDYLFTLEDGSPILNLKEAKSFLARTHSKTKYAANNVRDLDFDITVDDLMDIYVKQNGKCALTGWDLEFTRGGSYHNGTNAKAATIDRINNYSGYKKWNVQLTCWMPNRIKGALDNDEFIEFCNTVVNATAK